MSAPRTFVIEYGEQPEILVAESPEKAIADLLAEDWEDLYEGWTVFDMIEVRAVAEYRVHVDQGGEFKAIKVVR